MDYKKEFSEKFLYLLDEKNLNPHTFSKDSGLPYSTITEWINQKYLPQLPNLILISNYFHTSIDFLFGLTLSRHFFTLFEINFYDTLRQIMKDMKITSKQLLENCNITTSLLTFWKKGKLPQVDKLLNLHLYLKLPIEYIIGRTDKTSI